MPPFLGFLLFNTLCYSITLSGFFYGQVRDCSLENILKTAFTFYKRTYKKHF